MSLFQGLRYWQKGAGRLKPNSQYPHAERWTQLSRMAFLGLLAVGVGLAFAFSAAPGRAQSDPPPTDHLIWQLPGDRAAYRTAPFAPGELLVGFHGEEGLRSTATLLSAFSAEAVERLASCVLNSAKGEPTLTGYRLAVPEGQEWAIMEQLLQAPDVAFATPNWLVQAAVAAPVPYSNETADRAVAQPEAPFAVNDPKYEESQWYLQRINASRAWSLTYAEDGFAAALTTVQVAIIDSGIDVSHPEFRGRLMTGYNYLAPGAPPVDDYGHGTHVAGLIGAVVNNAVGIAGVAPKVRIDARKVLNSQGSGTINNVSQAICDAADAGATIINLSLESSAPNITMERAVRYADSKGVLLIAAAGNFYPSPVSWPAAYDEVMAVAATNYHDKHASYSNAGPQIELAAPGGERGLSILSSWPGGVKCRDNTTILPQSDYCTSEGTSMAAAIVSGAAALIKSVQPNYTGEQIRQLLRNSATPLNESAAMVGSGRLDVHTALRMTLGGRLVVSTKGFLNHIPLAGAPYTVTLRLDNPSLQPLNWRATLLNSQEWVRINDTTPVTNTTVISGAVSYGEPSYVSLTVTPTHLMTGSYAATLRVDQIKADNLLLSTFVDINVLVGIEQLHALFFPLVRQGAPVPITTPSFQWEIPLQADDRTSYTLPDNGQSIRLPEGFFTLRSEAYDSLRIFADGFVTFPDTSLNESLPNRCMPNLTQPAQAIYGWWADLNPSAAGARVSTFQPTSDQFVVEFENVPAAGVMPDYQVSFQIVLFRNGKIHLNYLDVPVTPKTMPVVTIGIEARDGLFYNQVACSTGATQVGYLPVPQQTLSFNAQEDLY